MRQKVDRRAFNFSQDVARFDGRHAGRRERAFFRMQISGRQHSQNNGRCQAGEYAAHVKLPRVCKSTCPIGRHPANARQEAVVP